MADQLLDAVAAEVLYIWLIAAGCALYTNKGALALDAASVVASFVPAGKGLLTVGAAVVGSYTGAEAIGIGVAGNSVIGTVGAAVGTSAHYV